MEVLRIAYVIANTIYLKRTPVAFSSGSNYDYHFIIKNQQANLKNNDYVKPKLFYIDTDIKTDDIYNDIAEDVETRFNTSNYESDRRFPKEKILKSNWINER